MLLALDLMDLDVCLLEDKLVVPADNNIPNIKAKLKSRKYQITLSWIIKRSIYHPW